MAELGQRALAGLDLDRLVAEAAETAARELGTEFASVVELTGDGLGLVVLAGHGLPDGVVGGVLSTRPDELPGFTLARALRKAASPSMPALPGAMRKG